MKLTEKVISSLELPSGKKDMLVFDDTVSGLGVRVGSKAKTFLVQYTSPDGRKKRVPLGRWGAMTLEQARAAARALVGQVASGADPASERKAAKEVAAMEAKAEKLTLRALLNDWAALALANRREGYRKEALRAVCLAFANYLDRRADSISRADAVQVLDGLLKAGKATTAARTRAYLRAAYSWAVKRDRLTANPFANLPIATAANTRDRVLTDEEVGAVFVAATAEPYPFGPFFCLLLLTTQRRDEVSGLRWSEISDDGTVWVLPAARAKNAKEHVVHLSNAARAVLAECPRQVGTDFVFTTTGTTPISGYSKATGRLVAATEAVRIEHAQKAGRTPPATMPDWRLHDFRRTCVTWLAGAGFPPHIADKLLNHSTATELSAVAQVYQRNAFLPERKAALEAWGAHVLACASGETTTTNVVSLARKPA